MVAVFDKNLVSWYLITLKLKETVESTLPKSQPTSPTKPICTCNPKPPLLLTQGEEEQTPSPNPPPDSEWVISIKEKLDQASQLESSRPWAKLSIYRVPKYLRETDEKVYVPQLVSIGPYHRSRRRLRDMEYHCYHAFEGVSLLSLFFICRYKLSITILNHIPFNNLLVAEFLIEELLKIKLPL